ncbi:flagellin [Altericroceibacterium xinjiangense]|uniref:flagellin N-terminal helical domain-containing protein n=1 Tax=Altericroceibacterium xinjiangense TaxID=762261 RepID=UPI0019CFD6DF
MVSILTNVAAQQALQILTASEKSSAGTRARIATGLAVASTRDDSAVFIQAQTLRGDQLSWNAVGTGLARWQSITDVGISGAEAVSDLIIELKQKAFGYADASDTQFRSAIRADMEALIDQIDRVVDSSEFGGVNLLKGVPQPATRSHYSYKLPGSTVNPSGFASVKMAAMPPGSSYSVAQSHFHQLPASPLTPDSFDAARSQMIGSNSKTISVDAGTTAGRVNLLVNHFGSPDTVEIWQAGVRVAASGRAYAADGEPVQAPIAATAPAVVSFDYDPAKGQQIEVRLNSGSSGTNLWSVAADSFQLQDPAEPVPAPFPVWNDVWGWSSTAIFDPPVASANPEEVAQALDDPLDERALPIGVSAEYTINGGPEAGRVDLVFDAFDLPDTMEVWQDGVRIAASGRSYQSGGAPVDDALAVTGVQRISFDYDPDAGPVTFRFNDGEADPNSAWLVGAISFRKDAGDPLPVPESGIGGQQYPAFGPRRYDINTMPGKTGQRISTHDLSSEALRLDANSIPWGNPQDLLDVVERAEKTVLDATAYFGRHHRMLAQRVKGVMLRNDVQAEALGALVDADLGKEHARLKAQEVGQQLAMQALAIANSAPEVVLTLFRS